MHTGPLRKRKFPRALETRLTLWTRWSGRVRPWCCLSRRSLGAVVGDVDACHARELSNFIFCAFCPSERVRRWAWHALRGCRCWATGGIGDARTARG
ncbi:hypothetical protein BDZ97DRAFT_1803755 [Flammula alnicola]|nr:hypothetical protein BDZ97DRAFT_1803755 [Flammula alnicola]